jgi:hypothetical protein
MRKTKDPDEYQDRMDVLAVRVALALDGAVLLDAVSVMSRMISHSLAMSYPDITKRTAMLNIVIKHMKKDLLHDLD